MKKFSLIIFLISLFILCPRVYAAGGFGVSTGSVTLHPGQSTTISISSNNAVGKLDISSSNSSVASVSTGSVFIQTPGSSQSFTITAKTIGTSIVSVVASSNFATMDEEKLTGQTRSITVNVVENTPSNNGSSSNSDNNVSNNSNSNNNKKEENGKSKNNNLKSISIDGYKLEKIDNNNYKLDVSNTVDEINIVATAEDLRLKVLALKNCLLVKMNLKSLLHQNLVQKIR